MEMLNCTFVKGFNGDFEYFDICPALILGEFLCEQVLVRGECREGKGEGERVCCCHPHYKHWLYYDRHIYHYHHGHIYHYQHHHWHCHWL